MPQWLIWAIDAVALLLVLSLTVIAVLGLRRRLLARGGTSFDLCLHQGNSWFLGMGRIRHERLEFFRAFSFSPRPKISFPRASITVLERRKPSEAETYATHAGFVVVEVFTSTEVTAMALDPAALTAMLAWLESSPPGNEGWTA